MPDWPTDALSVAEGDRVQVAVGTRDGDRDIVHEGLRVTEEARVGELALSVGLREGAAEAVAAAVGVRDHVSVSVSARDAVTVWLRARLRVLLSVGVLVTGLMVQVCVSVTVKGSHVHVAVSLPVCEWVGTRLRVCVRGTVGVGRYHVGDAVSDGDRVAV